MKKCSHYTTKHLFSLPSPDPTEITDNSPPSLPPSPPLTTAPSSTVQITNQSGKSQSSSSFLWSHLFSSDSVPPSTLPPFSTLSDGTPVILAPSDILLNASTAWSGYLLCQFFGDTPSATKIFSDLNPIWGRNGKISVKKFSEGTCLIHVPALRTREWILNSCLWSAGTVSFAVSEWSASPTLIGKSLTTAPGWLTLRELPPQLWTEAGAKMIAERLATVVPTSRVILPPDSLGTAKVRVIIRLAAPRPSSVIVQDTEGNQVKILVDYGRLPPLCPLCKNFGHLAHRCPTKRRSYTQSAPTVDSDAKTVQDGAQTTLQNPNQIIESNGPNISGPNNSSQPISHESHVQPISTEPIDTSQTQRISNSSPGIKSNSPIFDPSDPPRCHRSSRRRSSSPSGGKATFRSLSPKIKTSSHKSTISSAANSNTTTNVSDTHPPPPTSEPRQVKSSTPQVGLQLMQVPICISTSPSTPSESMAENKHFTNPHKEYSPNLTTNPDPTQTTFSFPPPAVHVLDLKTDHHSPSPFSDVPSQLQQTKMIMSTKVKKVVNKEKRQETLAINSFLRCKTVNYQFKPKGIVEKRRKKVNNDLLPDAEEVHQCIQEMQSDKKDTTYYEALQAHKILRKLDSDTTGALET